MQYFKAKKQKSSPKKSKQNSNEWKYFSIGSRQSIEDKIREKYSLFSRPIELGELETGQNIYFRPEDRKYHMHVIGSTGEGKSKFLENLIRQDILNNNGLCLIDPHGTLYENIIKWCENKGLLDSLSSKKFVLFDPSESDWSFGFNPLASRGTELSFFVDLMVGAVAKVWGDEDTSKTPLLKRALRSLFYALSYNQLTLYEAGHFLNPDNKKIREHLTKNLPDFYFKEQWDRFNNMSSARYEDQFLSSINRISEFLSSPILRTIVGQNQDLIDFKTAMDEGYIVLVNLGSAKDKISTDNAKLLGALLVNDLFVRARSRPEGAKPFYLYVDECGDFINEDMARILDQCRKFGLHLILAHQHLAQLGPKDKPIYSSVMTNAKTKVVFGGLNIDDAEVMAKTIFIGDPDILNLEEAKESLKKPVVVGHIKAWLKSYSESEGFADGHSSSKSSGGGAGGGSSENIVTVPNPISGEEHVSSSAGSFETSSKNWGHSESVNYLDTHSKTKGEHEVYKPVLEEKPGPVFSLEEQIYKAMALMVNQSTQHAIVKFPKKFAKFIKTKFIESPFVTEDVYKAFRERCYGLTDFVKPQKTAIEQIEKRQQYLLAQSEKEEAEALVEPKSWREPAGKRGQGTPGRKK